MIDGFLLEVLACPKCDSRPPVELKNGRLVCTVCGFGYPIVDGIPQMLIEEAIDPKDLEKENAGE